MDIINLIIGISGLGVSIWAIVVAKSVSQKYIAHFTLPNLISDLEDSSNDYAIFLGKNFNKETIEELNKIIAKISAILSDLEHKIEKKDKELLEEIINKVDSDKNIVRDDFVLIQNKLISLLNRLKYQNANRNLKI